MKLLFFYFIITLCVLCILSILVTPQPIVFLRKRNKSIDVSAICYFNDHNDKDDKDAD